MQSAMQSPMQRDMQRDVQRDMPRDSPLTLNGEVSGFWRRLLALCLDGLILGILGVCIGAFMFDTLASLGALGRVIGFAVALPYYGIMNSRVCHGRTFGKMAMQIRVASIDGEPLPLLFSFVRSSVFCVPYFLGGAAYYFVQSRLYLAGALSALISLVYFADVYLFAFNRKSRQSLHDLAVHSFVIRNIAGTAQTPIGKIWRGHLAALGGIALLGSAAAVSTGTSLSQVRDAYVETQKRVLGEPAVRTASLDSRVTTFYGKQTRTTHQITVAVTVDSKDVPHEALANRIGRIVMEGLPDTERNDYMAVVVRYGYDIGIASYWLNDVYIHTPAQWRALANSG